MSGLWSETDYPATATAASAAKADPGSNLVARCRALTVSVSADPAESTILRATLWDGPAVTGVVLWAGTLHAQADASQDISINGVDLRASLGNVLTLTLDAPDTGCQGAVSMSGDLARSGANYGV